LTTLFQLVAVGEYAAFNGIGKIYSKQVFTERQDAENHKPEFLDRCCGDGLSDLKREATRVEIVDLELVTGDKNENLHLHLPASQQRPEQQPSPLDQSVSDGS